MRYLLAIHRGICDLWRRKAKGSEGRFWRREWDSNPRYGFPYTRFPSVRLQPLGHPSADPFEQELVGIGEAQIEAPAPHGSKGELAIPQCDATPPPRLSGNRRAASQVAGVGWGRARAVSQSGRGRVTRREIIGRPPPAAGRRMWASADRRARRRRGPCWPTGTRSSSARRRRALA